MGKVSRQRIALWSVLFLILVAVAAVFTRPREAFAVDAPSDKIDVWIDANGGLRLNDESIQHKAWIHRLQVAAIQVPQPPIRIHPDPDTPYGVVHQTFHDAWSLHLPRIGYVVAGEPEGTVWLSDPTKQQVRNEKEPITLHIDAHGAMYWDGVPIETLGLQAQLAVLALSEPPARVVIQVDDQAAWSQIAGPLSNMARCGQCAVGLFEETDEVAQPWRRPPPPPPRRWK